MPPDEFDFIKAFADVDILQVEAVGAVIGRVVASLYNGMIAGGLTEAQTDMVIRMALAEFWRGLRG